MATLSSGNTLVNQVGVETVAKSLLPTYCFGAYLMSVTNREPLVSTFKSGTNRDKIFYFFVFRKDVPTD